MWDELIGSTSSFACNHKTEMAGMIILCKDDLMLRSVPAPPKPYFHMLQNQGKLVIVNIFWIQGDKQSIQRLQNQTFSEVEVKTCLSSCRLWLPSFLSVGRDLNKKNIFTV